MPYSNGQAKDQQFLQITPHLAIRVGLVFTGEQAVRAGMVKWPRNMTHYKPARTFVGRPLLPTRKLYLTGNVQGGSYITVCFSFQQCLEAQMSQLGIAEDRIDIDIRRLGGKAACARNGEGVLWGFGRPHPTKPDFKPHGEFAGPLVDHRPGQLDGWEFMPVYVGVKDAGQRYSLRIETHWLMGDIGVSIFMNPLDLPPELARYVRPMARPAVVSG